MAEYDVTYYGWDEARFHKLLSIITGGTNIADLNSHLAINPTLGIPFQFTSSDFKIGDTMYLPRTRLSIVGGGEIDGRDQDISENMIGRGYGQGFKSHITTTLVMYLLDDDFNAVADPFLNAQAKELFMARVAGFFVHNIFNTKVLGQINLDSHVMRPLPNSDPFYNQGITRVEKTITLKGVDDMFECLTVKMTHEMEIR